MVDDRTGRLEGQVRHVPTDEEDDDNDDGDGDEHVIQSTGQETQVPLNGAEDVGQVEVQLPWKAEPDTQDVQVVEVLTQVLQLESHADRMIGYNVR